MMKLTVAILGLTLTISGLPLAAQKGIPGRDGAPLYSVTVVERTTEAINYQYRAGPTQIGFRGTVLLPEGKGEATVESRRGSTEIDASFKNLKPPSRYGPEYLTYTLWAITPDGGARNLAEVVPNGGDKAKVRVTTDLQAFGLIVTAEPYATVRRPSNVVVLENVVRPDTLGSIKPIEAKYELMPRGHYTWNVPNQFESAVSNAPKVSMSQYEALLELYEAQNAVAIARAAGADTLAPNAFQKAESLLEEAQRQQANKAPSAVVVQFAREASETAEDASVIAARRRQDAQVAKLKEQAVQAQQAAAAAQAQVQQARAEADAARAQADAERAARERADAAAAQARDQAAQVAAASSQIAAPPPPTPVQRQSAQQSAYRMQLLEQLNGVLAARDTPRGLVVTVGDAGFRGGDLRPETSSQLARLAAILAQQPGLHLSVEGYTDSASTDALSWRRAQDVQHVLVAQGLPDDNVSARGMGDARPVVSNASVAGREENRRVEIVITGPAIGDMPIWDRAYNLTVTRNTRQ
ncbi:MAG TPA: OmpA family protein [Bryobacteraceae bacterium]|nr:OmpA family protein [Bryobacteraceae bacterium]